MENLQSRVLEYINQPERSYAVSTIVKGLNEVGFWDTSDDQKDSEIILINWLDNDSLICTTGADRAIEALGLKRAVTGRNTVTTRFVVEVTYEGGNFHTYGRDGSSDCGTVMGMINHLSPDNLPKAAYGAAPLRASVVGYVTDVVPTPPEEIYATKTLLTAAGRETLNGEGL